MAKRNPSGAARSQRMSWPDSLLQRMEPQENGCIYFTGLILPHGYGRVSIKGVVAYAHRAAYELFVGPIPPGYTIDHECHNRDEACAGGVTCLHRRCVNVEHLRPIARGENVMASDLTLSARKAAQTHCERGHEFDQENTYIRPNGTRRCKACARLRRARNAKV